MTIDLPQDIEASVRSLVQDGRYESVDQVVAEAVRAFLCSLKEEQRAAMPGPGATPSEYDQITEFMRNNPIMGLMRDEPEMMDEIVEGIYRRRRQSACWKCNP